MKNTKTLILGVLCLYYVTGVFSQQFVPPFRPVPSSPAQRRQFLTPVQQTHILSDIQQHQHRFNVHNTQFQKNVNINTGRQPQQQPNNQRVTFVQQPSLGAQLPSQSQAVTFLAPSGPNQAPRQLIFVPQNQVQQVQQQLSKVNLQAQPLQHHTQTAFIPNFAQQQQVQNNRLSQRTVQNQLGSQFHQQQQQPQAQPSQTNSFQFPLSSNAQTSGLQEQFPPFNQPPVRFNNLAPVAPTHAHVSNNNNRFPSPSFRQQASQAPFIASQPLPANPPFSSINQQVQPFPAPQSQGSTQNSFFQIQPSIGNQVETIITETHNDGTPQQPFFTQQASIQSSQQFLQPLAPTNNVQLAETQREKQRLIQKHEQFFAKQYAKELSRAEELHKEFLRKQQNIKSKHQELRHQPIPHYQTNQGRVVLPSDQTYFQEALRQYNIEHPTTTTTTTTTQAPTTKARTSKATKGAKNNVKEIYIDNPADLSQLLASQKDKLLSLLNKDNDASISKSKSKTKGTKAAGKDDLLKQLKLALANQPQDLGDKEVDSMDLVLPNGEKVQVIRTSDPELIRRAGADPSQVITQEAKPKQTFDTLEELQKNLPEGADFEIIKQTSDGRQEVVKVPPKKKVTFVYLEEQNDGSYKVQGVKSDKDKEAKTSGVEVDSILKRIKNGEIKLPGESHLAEDDDHVVANTPIPSSARPSSVTVIPLSTPYKEIKFHRSTTKQPKYTSRQTFESTAETASPYSTLPTFLPTQNTARSQFVSRVTTPRTTSAATTPHYVDNENIYEPSPSEASEVSTSIHELSNILKNNNLHAMAKYLKQSGLDSILNETGPYTIFVPTDKAFKSLLVQLGGPDKAEEKFKNNPRLLSGLLLHHVIPGAFEIGSLQDEMTGVSLAGTQLRVNQYTMQDPEWNDVTLTTINGAMIVNDKQDIQIPQGIAHAIDRVMFPLPVGDVLQTLQSDRERRFTNFLRALFTSGMSDTLQNKGVKTYTVFAPTDSAFQTMPPEELTQISTDKDAAEKFVKKHVVPGTLFTAGMRFYQVKESMAEGKSVTLQKNGGKIRVNDSTMVSSNIPATNGVIHAIDNML